jgi:hypothetical protein
MRLTASDFMTHWRPSPCELRVFLLEKGEWAMAMFIEATETCDEGKRKELMDEILKYNEEDLAVPWAVFEWLREKHFAL